MFKKTNRKPLNTVDHSATLNFQIKEAYKTARTNLVFSVIKEGCKKIVVTSSLKSEGKTTTAVNLAIALAQQVDTKVLIIDCDLRKPKVDRFFNLSAAPGLTNVLGKIHTVDEAVHHTKMENLDILCAGVIPPNPSELLSSESMKQLLASFSDEYDYIILDTPPVNVVVDALPLITESDGVLIVVREGTSTYPELHKTVEAIKRVDAKILGLIINGVDTKNGKGGYFYRYE